MNTAASLQPARKLRDWQIVLLFGLLQFAVYGLAAFLVETYSGGCMFVIPGYFYALITVLAILKVPRFGVGMAVFLPCAVIGAIMDYYIEWVANPALRGAWGAFAWALVFLGYGLIADLAFRFLPHRWSEARRAAYTGLSFGLGFFLLTWIALATFYTPSGEPGHLSFFTQGAPFSLPWLALSGAFGGYTAWALAGRKPA